MDNCRDWRGMLCCEACILDMIYDLISWEGVWEKPKMGYDCGFYSSREFDEDTMIV